MARVPAMRTLENALRRVGFVHVAGVDEAKEDLQEIDEFLVVDTEMIDEICLEGEKSSQHMPK